MARILLIKASDIGHYKWSKHPWMGSFAKRFNFAMVPPLGLMMIASVLRDNGNEVRILDMREIEVKGRSLRGEIERFAPEIAGISAITTEAPSLHAAADAVKKADPKTTVIAGGPHPSSFTEKVLSDPNIDYAVLGEGEETAPDLVDAVLTRRVASDVKGIAFRRNGGVVRTTPRPFIQDINTLPYPAWDLVDLDFYGRYRSMASVGLRKYMTLFTSRACPYRCIYCHNMFGKKYRTRSVGNIVREMEILKKDYGVEDFEILDDIFNLDLPRADAVCDGILGKKLAVNFSFPNALRGDRLPSDLIGKLKRAGLNFTSIAVETASPRIQRLIKKNLNLGRVREAIKELHRQRIFTRGFFMLGFPTETREEMLETVRFAVESELPSAMFFIVIPFEGTELENIASEKGKDASVDFRGYDYFSAPFNLSRESTTELQKLQKYAVWRFNASLWRLYEIISIFPRKRHLYVYALGVIKTFFLDRGPVQENNGQDPAYKG